MKIFGHPHIPHPVFKRIHSTQDIDKILASNLIWWQADDDLQRQFAHFCKEHQIPYAVHIQNITELLVYANLNAKYLIISDKASLFQSLVKEYLLDCLLLYTINQEKEISTLALQGIDGVIFQHLLNN